MLECDQALELISAHIDGVLTPEEERALLRGAGTLEGASAALLDWCARTMATCTGEDGALFWEKAWKSAPECGMIDKTLDPSVS